jgi:hypothetical protein
MAFPVNSTSTITDAVERICRVLQRTKRAAIIASAGVYNCRKISGSNSWSQQAWGNAVDLFPKGIEYAEKQQRCVMIANAVVYQATHKTISNRRRKLDVARVIDHENRRDWTPQDGWTDYSGSYGLHVHVEGKPLGQGTPPCA